ncbi:uncharacterized protein LOC111371017 [Olea europaea var. sylvestris]|uniref:uncharacterized protein LOC111371017 n=1 Tax=Olea europaea var. sylvestris TaxID=158386 RepID=UPI000C1D84D3|nr:uncharacterized protein LOC111371017 [Olea europaea var. sylvestris]
MGKWRIDQLVDSILRHEPLSFMDDYSGYNQIPMHPINEEHTPFTTDRDPYCYRVMFFGLRNTGTAYQRLVIGCLLTLLEKQKRRYRMRLNLLKCAFRVASRKFLGYMVNQSGIEANSEKIRALIEMRLPQKPNEIQFDWVHSSLESLCLKEMEPPERPHGASSWTAPLGNLLASLRLAIEMQVKRLVINNDSQPVVNQVNDSFLGQR